MSASKDIKRGTWKVYIRYKDWQGNNQIKTKRGFSTKREALEWEREFLESQSKDINMKFASFIEIYLRDIKPRLKLNTYMTKVNIIDTKIKPYFKNKSLSEIDAADVIKWQNELISYRDENDKSYTDTYLRTIQNQLSAIFNHAVRFYGLSKNPSQQAGKMGKSSAKEMSFWTLDEYNQFIETMKDKPMSFYAFEVLYWTGVRVGELLALTKGDFDFENRLLRIDKSYQRIQSKDYITDPKTEQSNRTISLPKFLCDEIEDYIASLYKIDDNTRIFPITKRYLHHEIERGCKKSGVKKIRVHDLRHSHCAHLIESGLTPVAIAERLGHKGVSITFMYSHLYPKKQEEIANMLDRDKKKLREK